MTYMMCRSRIEIEQNLLVNLEGRAIILQFFQLMSFFT